MTECKICEKEITDQGEIPTVISIAGWMLDEDNEPATQYTIYACRDCFINRNDEILKQLEMNTGEYE